MKKSTARFLNCAAVAHIGFNGERYRAIIPVLSDRDAPMVRDLRRLGRQIMLEWFAEHHTRLQQQLADSSAVRSGVPLSEGFWWSGIIYLVWPTASWWLLACSPTRTTRRASSKVSFLQCTRFTSSRGATLSPIHDDVEGHIRKDRGMWHARRILMLLSGFVFPIESMPAFFRYFTMILPARWFIVITRESYLKGSPLLEMGTAIAALGILCAIMVLAATRKFKKDLEP
jgi:hypothetical protein